MVHNEFIKCQVCGAITRVRLQVGFLDEHPIIIRCGGCGISLKGTAHIGQEYPSLSLDFENADKMSDPDVEKHYNYVVECSGEFPTEKQIAIVGENSNPLLDVNPITPYIRFGIMADYEKFGKAAGRLKYSVKRWDELKRVFQLYYAGKDELVLQELTKLLECDSKNYEGDKLFLIAGVNSLKHLLFGEVLVPELVNYPYKYDLGCFTDSQKISDLISFLNSHSGYELSALEKSVFDLLCEFVDVWQYLIPAFSLEFLKDGITFDYDKNGTTSSSFASIDKFYADAYETLGNLLIIPVALDNIFHRTGYDDCLLLSGRSCSLEYYINSITKGKRYSEANNAERYMSKLALCVEPQIRNAINHNDYDFDPVTQLVVYHPRPQDRSVTGQKYLLQIEEEILGIIRSVLVVSEYLYYLRKFELLDSGFVPINIPTPCKIVSGRNEPCPCGSGRKFKQCHGRHDALLGL